jgi:cytochrome d ubiquinol oxidase subunit I
MAKEETRYSVEVPHLGSLLLTHTFNEPVPALKDFAPADRPNSTVVFWTFRLMVGLGLLMIALGFLGLGLRRGDRLWHARPFLRFALWMGPSGIVALLAGWFTTEMGRQPWVVYGLLRTADAVSHHGAMELSVTLIAFILVYFVVFGSGLLYMMRLIRIGPVLREGDHPLRGGPGHAHTPMRPLSAADRRNTARAAQYDTTETVNGN